jgi:hypothetical protein
VWLHGLGTTSALGIEVKSLEVKLSLSLDRHKTHVRALHGSSNGLGVDVVVLARLQKPFYKLCWPEVEPRDLALPGLHPRMRPTTRFHTDPARWNLRRVDHHLGAGQALPGHHLAMRIHAHQWRYLGAGARAPTTDPFQLTQHVLLECPNWAGILSHKRIERQQRNTLNRRLCHQQTIKGIPVNRRQALDGDDMIADDRQFVVVVV